MPLVQKISCKKCHHKFNVYFRDDTIDIKHYFQVTCPNCEYEIGFVDGFGQVINVIPKGAAVAEKL